MDPFVIASPDTTAEPLAISSTRQVSGSTRVSTSRIGARLRSAAGLNGRVSLSLITRTEGHALAHFPTVSHVRVVTSVPKAFSINVMNTGPFSLRT